MISENSIKGGEVGIGCQDSSFPVIQYNELTDNNIDILVQDRSDPTTTLQPD
jgi:hypothetical protein